MFKLMEKDTISNLHLNSFAFLALIWIYDLFISDESGSDSDGADSTSSSYSSLSDFVTDMVNSEIDGDTPCEYEPLSDYILMILHEYL